MISWEESFSASTVSVFSYQLANAPILAQFVPIVVRRRYSCKWGKEVAKRRGWVWNRQSLSRWPQAKSVEARSWAGRCLWLKKPCLKSPKTRLRPSQSSTGRTELLSKLRVPSSVNLAKARLFLEWRLETPRSPRKKARFLVLSKCKFTKADSVSTKCLRTKKDRWTPQSGSIALSSLFFCQKY